MHLRALFTVFVATHTALLAMLLTAAGPRVASAIDGATEISHGCATSGGCSSSDGPGYPITILDSGRYVLTSDLAPPDRVVDAIQVLVSDVDLDFNGFAIEYPASGAGSGRGVAASTTIRTRVRDGSILHPAGDAVITGNGSRVENMIIESAGGIGIGVGGESLVRDCKVGSTGSYGIDGLFGARIIDNSVIFAGQSSAAAGIRARDASIIRGNIVRLSNSAGIVSFGETARGLLVEGNVSSGNTFGIITGVGALIRNNVVYDNSSTGIITSQSSILENTIHSNGAGITGNESTIVGNTVYGNSSGIGSGGGVVVNNVASGNSGIGLNGTTGTAWGSNAINANASGGNQTLGVDTANQTAPNVCQFDTTCP